MFSLIVAIAENNVIGNQNKLIWHLPADLKFFRTITMGHPIVMGRKTFESIGKALPGRRNIVISRDKNFSFTGVEVFNDVQSVTQLFSREEEVMIIGGAEIYRMFLPHCNRMYLTRVHQEFEGDTFFPPLDLNEWTLESEDFHTRDEKNPFDYSFLIYDRKELP
jgi:dihydrofolate reductase